jgi:hypothetical protein
VEPGRQTALTMSAAFSGASGSGIVLPAGPAWAFREAYGWFPSGNPDGLGVEWGLEGSLLNGATGDAYLRVPHGLTGKTDAGIGVAALAGEFAGPMTYAQIGRQTTPNVYVYTTQNVSWLRRSEEGLRRVGWHPAIAVELRGDDGRNYAVFLAGTFGPTEDPCQPDQTTGRCPSIHVHTARVAVGFSRLTFSR